MVVEERRMRTDDDPVNSLYEETVSTAFKAHPYQWPVVGWMHDVENITRQEAKDYYNRYYQPNNATLVVVGDIDPEAALSGNSRYLRQDSQRSGAAAVFGLRASPAGRTAH